MYPTTWTINRTFSKSEILAESLVLTFKKKKKTSAFFFSDVFVQLSFFSYFLLIYIFFQKKKIFQLGTLYLLLRPPFFLRTLWQAKWSPDNSSFFCFFSPPQLQAVSIPSSQPFPFTPNPLVRHFKPPPPSPIFFHYMSLSRCRVKGVFLPLYPS